jgi:GMP reductase
MSYVPIVASNMDGMGTFSMAKVLQEFEMLTVLRKHYTI